MPTSPRQAPVSGGVCALHPPHRHERPSHTPPSAPPIHPSSTAGPRHLPRACLGRSNPHRRISLRFRPTRFLSTVAAVVSGPHPSARAPRRHTKNALRLRHTVTGAVRGAPPCVVSRVGFYVLHTSSACARTRPAECTDGWPRRSLTVQPFTPTEVDPILRTGVRHSLYVVKPIETNELVS